MSDFKDVHTPTKEESVLTDLDGAEFQENNQHASIVSMLMKLAANTHPDIDFAVNQAARFT